MFKIALQLYSLREQFENDAEGTLEKIASAGYAGVETFTLLDMPAPAFKKKLDKLGLSCVSMHVMDRDIDKIVDDAKALGAAYAVIPFSTWESDAEGQELLRFIKENAQKVRAAGLQWLYHNHSHEFVKHAAGKDLFDLLLSDTGKDQINLQIDTYWVELAGVPVSDFIKRAEGRIGCFHLKDEREIGAGKIDFHRVLSAAKEIGHEWLIIEQEEFDIDPFESIRISCNNVLKIAEEIS